MRVVIELEPASAGADLILSNWQATWGTSADGGGTELAAEASLSALLDLRQRCFDRGLTVNAFFPDNH